MVPRDDWNMWNSEGSSYLPESKKSFNPLRTLARWLRRLRRR